MLASVAAAAATGCKTRLDSLYAARPDPDAVATDFNGAADRLAGILDECVKSRAGKSNQRLVPVDPGRVEAGLTSRVLEPLSVVAIPGGMLYAGLKWLAFEDADPVFRASRYQSYLWYDGGRDVQDAAKEVDDARAEARVQAPLARLDSESAAIDADTKVTTAIDKLREARKGLDAEARSAWEEQARSASEAKASSASEAEANRSRDPKAGTPASPAPRKQKAQPKAKQAAQMWQAHTAPPIAPDETIEIYVESLLTDRFTEGRWRDSLGGDGEELALQVSLNGLTKSGALAKDDVQFLIEKSVQFRDPVLTLLQGNERGARLVAKYNDVAREALSAVGTAGAHVQVVKDWIASLGKERDFSKPEIRAKALEELRAALELKLEDVLRRDMSTAKRDAYRDAGTWIIDRILRWAGPRLESSAGRMPELGRQAEKEVTQILGAAEEFVAWAAKYSIDEKGLIETMKAVQGLAAADRLTTLAFTGIRPGLLEDAIANAGRALGMGNASAPTYGGTAARLLLRNDDPNGDYITAGGTFVNGGAVAAPPGLVYRGKLRDVAATGDAEGISLSVLLLELDSDEMVKVLKYAQAFVAEGATIGGGSSEIAVSAILDAATIVAERIAQNDVELKCIDLRFIPKDPTRQGTPGQLVFDLRPCRVVVGRNIDGTDFGAVAVVRIRKVPDKPSGTEDVPE